MADPLKFDAPEVSQQQLALRKYALAAKRDEGALRDLLWLVNSHPELIAHAQIFANLATQFAGPVFAGESLEWAGVWKESSGAWRDLCEWIWAETQRLARVPELASNFHVGGGRSPHHQEKHPIFRLGMERHAIAAAIWTIHHSVPHYPPPPENIAGSRYWELQGHVLAAYVECRHRLSSRDFYENYSERIERPVAPMRGKSVGPALRVLSLPDYDSLLLQLPATHSTKEYAQKIAGQKFSFGKITDARTRARAMNDIAALKRFFARFLRVLDGWIPPQTTRRGWGGGGGSDRRQGFIQFLAAPGIYVEDPPPVSDDPDLNLPGHRNIFADRDPANDAAALEAAGLAPTETLEKLMSLILPEEVSGRFLQLERQRRAREMAPQLLPFAYEILTAEEVAVAWRLADSKLLALANAPRVTDDILNPALVGMLVRLSMAYSQPLERLLKAKIIWIKPGQTVHELPDGDIEIALIFRSSTGTWDDAEFVGLLLQGIMPDYRTILPDELEEIDGPYADSFVLPDLLGIGPDLIACLRRRNRNDSSAFGIELATVKSVFKRLAGAAQDERLTLAKLAIFLSRQMIYLTGDQSLAWVTFADMGKRNEPRMHYTRHPILKIQASYRRACRILARITNRRLANIVAPEIAPPTPATSVGARFVLPLAEAGELVRAIIEFLTEPNVDRDDPQHIAAYHNNYLFYLALFQALETATRSPTSADDLFEYWRMQQDVRGRLPASLSDKTSVYHDKTRLTYISPALSRQFAHYDDHVRKLINSPQLALQAVTTGRKFGPFFSLSVENGRLVMAEASAGWIADMLKETSAYPIPVNFARATLRCELLARDCVAQVVDAFLGHFNHGESPFGALSTFDFDACWSTLTPFLDAIRGELGLRPVASRLLPFSERRKEVV